jgi:hypothetical protein
MAGLALSALLVFAQAAAGVEEQQFAAERAAAPLEIQRLVARWEGCNHWLGESADNEADDPHHQRARQIAGALRTLRCHALPSDIAQVRRRYAKDPKVQKLLRHAHEMFD